jgi:NAD(P)-dependent dehydrogenase (short-subunit alcohol dehydrogenase family)
MSTVGKVAVITGAAGGIGLAISQRYARDGMVVVLTDLPGPRGEREAAALRESGHDARFEPLDTTDEAAVEALFDKIVADLGGVDVVVCSAGISSPGKPFQETTLADFNHVLEVNLAGPFIVGKAAANRMIARKKGGAIINVSSVGAVLGLEHAPAYCTSKAGVGMLTKVMALAMAEYDIRVNAVAPGPTWSPMTRDTLDQGTIDLMLSRTPMGRFAEVDEMAGVAAFLAGTDSSFITGQTIYADGGRLALNYVVAKTSPL